MKISQYPRNTDGTPLDLEVGVLTDESGNGGARIPTAVVGPDNTPIETKGLIVVDETGEVVDIKTAMLMVATRDALAAAPTARGTIFLMEEGRAGVFAWHEWAVEGEAAAAIADTAQGIFVISDSDPTAAFGAWRRRYDGSASVRWFGATGDGVTDDSEAFVVAMAVLRLMPAYRDIYYTTTPKLLVPAGHYFMGTTTLDFTQTMIIEGEGQGQIGIPTSRLRWAAGASGIRTQRYNTQGATGVLAPGQNAGDGCRFTGLYVEGGYVEGGAEGEFHGFDLRSRASIDDCYVIGWQGDGLHSNCAQGVGAPEEGNANSTSVRRSTFTQSRRGIYVDGADTNVWLGQELNVSGNRQWGIEDNSFLGNTWDNCHNAANGWYSDNWTPTAVAHMGNRFAVKVGQAAGASVNAPPATATDNAWWIYWGAGGVFPGVPAWFNGIVVREGGSYKTDNLNARSRFRDCYSEGDQNPAQFANTTLIDGGLHAAGTRGGCVLRINDRTLVVDGNGLQIFGGNPSASIEHQARDGTAAFLNFVQTNKYYLYTTANGIIFSLSSTGELDTKVSYSVNGTKVLGAQGAAIADAALAAAAPTKAEFDALVGKFNTLLARLRTATGHGIIA